ncbi:MAG: hypothetical protein J7M21_00035, partial [Planctomycetes bacterium]|nr:hypothetical protein [Planctomycetota bacterium]
AYIFGCLITGGEVRRARLMPSGEGGRSAEPAAEAAPRWKVAGPIVAALLAIIACGAAIGLADRLLGEPVMGRFDFAQRLAYPSARAQAGGLWGLLWLRLDDQLRLLRGMCETLARLDWLDWRVPVFVYLSICLSVRLAPVQRQLRATLAAASILAVAIVVVGAASSRFDEILAFVKPILTYVWGLLLLLLVVSLLVRGAVALLGVLRGRDTA